MAYQIQAVTCPSCYANLPHEVIEQRLKFCPYCGTSLLISDENEQTIRYIDEAELKRAETEHIVQMNDIRLRNKQYEDHMAALEEEAQKEAALQARRAAIKKSMTIKKIVFIVTILIGILTTFGGGGSSLFIFLPVAIVLAVLIKYDNKRLMSVGLGEMIRVPYGTSDCEAKNYTIIVSAFRSAGFVNVKPVPLRDLTLDLKKKVGTVKEITVFGEVVDSKLKRFPKEAEVTITYHSFR